MYIVIHYSEIGLKGKNRVFFEKMLSRNIGNMLSGVKEISRRYGKIIVELEKSVDPEQSQKILSLTPGISSFAFARIAKNKIEDIEKVALDILSGTEFKTFRITCRRSCKLFHITSQEVNIILGELVVKKLGKKVKLDNPDVNLFIEISERESLLYTKKFSGVGGLPVGSSGKAVALLSGGIDSPVASFLGAKRGLKVIFVHVLNKTMSGGRIGVDKIKKIVKELTKVQGESKLYVIPFEEIQKAIIANVPAESRMIVYRRFMMRIAQMIANSERAKGIITGDSVGQVASQTLENLKCIYDGLDLPVLPPLIGMNKEEIIKIARNIGTYELSIVPYPDCCSFMIAKHPVTKGHIKKIKELETALSDIDKLVEESVSKATKEIIPTS